MSRFFFALTLVSAVSAFVHVPLDLARRRTSPGVRINAANTGISTETASHDFAPSSEIHLLSVLRPNWKTASPCLKYFWSWKLDVMGLAMTKKHYRQHRLSELVVESLPKYVREAVVISNCQRLAVLVAADVSAESDLLRTSIASMFEQQVRVWEQNSNVTVIKTFTAGDQELQHKASGVGSDTCEDLDAMPPGGVNELFTFLSGTEHVSRYLCQVAAGIPPETTLSKFAPYSSRDAHVLNQIKHAFAAASTEPEEPDGADLPCKALLSTVLRGCLEAGKMARDDEAIPELCQLRSECTPTGTDREQVALVALQRAVEPVVARTASNVAALDRGRIISQFRARAQSVADRVRSEQAAQAREHGRSPPERGEAQLEGAAGLSLAVRRVLHAPTVALRHSQPVNEALVMRQVASAAAGSHCDCDPPLPRRTRAR